MALFRFPATSQRDYAVFAPQELRSLPAVPTTDSGGVCTGSAFVAILQSAGCPLDRVCCNCKTEAQDKNNWKVHFFMVMIERVDEWQLIFFSPSQNCTCYRSSSPYRQSTIAPPSLVRTIPHIICYDVHASVTPKMFHLPTLLHCHYIFRVFYPRRMDLTLCFKKQIKWSRSSGAQGPKFIVKY